MGHLANALTYTQQLLNYENVIIVGGLNNIDNGVENKDIERNLIFKQLTENKDREKPYLQTTH